MKFFHLSDLHIGLKLMNRDLREDQEYIFRRIVSLALEEKPDAVVIAGDIYDKAVPSAEAVEVFDRFLLDLSEALPKAEIMMISGNHDSAPRVNCFRSLLSRQRVHMIGMPPQSKEERMEKVRLLDEYGPVNFYLLPFVRPSMVRQVVIRDGEEGGLSYDETVRRMIRREEIDERERNVLVSHQFYIPSGRQADEIPRMDSEIRTVGNIDQVSADILEAFDYSALGHIHKPMAVGRETIRYCGTPMAVSVSEAEQEKGIVAVELLEKGKVRVRTIPLHPLRQIRLIRGSLEQVLAQACGDYAAVVLTEEKDSWSVDTQERLKRAFPFLLEVRREKKGSVYRTENRAGGVQTDPFLLCCSFLGQVDQEERTLLKNVLDQIWEVN